jgi:hypothetical protein
MLRALRYTRAALLVFGLGLALGFVVVVGEFRFGRIASIVMAFGLFALMPAFVADLRALVLRAWTALRRPRRRKASAARGRARAKARPPPRRREPARSPRGRRA